MIPCISPDSQLCCNWTSHECGSTFDVPGAGQNTEHESKNREGETSFARCSANTQWVMSQYSAGRRTHNTLDAQQPRTTIDNGASY